MTALAVLAAANAEATVQIGKASDKSDTPGHIDLSQARIQQTGPNLNIAVRTHGKWGLKSLVSKPGNLNDPARYVCVVVRQAKKSRAYCPSRTQKGKVRLLAARVLSGNRTGTFKAVKGAAISRKSSRQLTLKASLKSLGLVPGAFRWHVTSNWSGPACEELIDDVLTPIDCADVLPNKAPRKSRLRKPQITGCTTKPGVVHHGNRGKKWIALTYDDGPGTGTKSILETLRKTGTRATFFMVGSLVGPNASTARQVLAQGSEVANHSWAHEINPGQSSLNSTNVAIRKATGFSPCMFRPPYGSMGGGTLAGARNLGMATIIWDIDTFDYRMPGAATIRSRALNGRSGSIVLMHDGGGPRHQTAQATVGMINTLKLRGYTLVTVSEMLGAKTTWTP